MNIHNTLKKHLHVSSKEKIAQQLGYNSADKGIKALNLFYHMKTYIVGFILVTMILNIQQKNFL